MGPLLFRRIALRVIEFIAASSRAPESPPPGEIPNHFGATFAQKCIENRRFEYIYAHFFRDSLTQKRKGRKEGTAGVGVGFQTTVLELVLVDIEIISAPSAVLIHSQTPSKGTRKTELN